MAEIKICEICRKSVPQKDIEEGIAVERDGKWVCGQCSEIGRKHKDPFHRDALTMLEKISEEIRSIFRAISYREASIWTVLGAVIQIFVVFSIGLSASLVCVDSKNFPAALWWMGLALVLQAMALTFFILGR